MKKVLCFMLLASSAAFAQQAAMPSQNPVTDSLRQVAARYSRNLTAAAEQMPADKYSFRPTEAQQTFGHMIEHTAEANNMLCARASGQAAPKSTVKEADGKDKLVAALKQSFDFCTTALAGVKDAQLGDEVELFGGRKGPKAAAVFSLTNEVWANHYAVLAVHMRLNNLLPPTAQQRAAAAAAAKSAEKK